MENVRAVLSRYDYGTAIESVSVDATRLKRHKYALFAYIAVASSTRLLALVVGVQQSVLFERRVFDRVQEHCFAICAIVRQYSCGVLAVDRAPCRRTLSCFTVCE